MTIYIYQQLNWKFKISKKYNEQNKLMNKTEPEVWKRGTNWQMSEERKEGDRKILTTDFICILGILQISC